ncbi:glycosyltransferase [Lactobacillus sp. XV13L]|nr:glycosyltransferase [Lactobacillus sp. XV13L]
MDKVNVLGVDFDNKSFQQFQTAFSRRIDKHRSTLIVTANPEIVMEANENPEFMKILNHRADYITPDGIGIVKAAKILKTPLKERVTGYDLFSWLMELANKRRLRVYLIGARPNVLAAVKDKVEHEYANIQLVGAQDGYFKEDLDIVAYQIERATPDLVFAALGAPRQEQLLALLRRDNLRALMMGVGGSFDVFAGVVKRAPQFWQTAHLEWLYRLLRNPRRIKRVMILPRFMLEVYRVRGKKGQP